MTGEIRADLERAADERAAAGGVGLSWDGSRVALHCPALCRRLDETLATSPVASPTVLGVLLRAAVSVAVDRDGRALVHEEAAGDGRAQGTVRRPPAPRTGLGPAAPGRPAPEPGRGEGEAGA